MTTRKSGYPWLRGHPATDPKPPAVARHEKARRKYRSARAGSYNWDLLMLHGAAKNLRSLVLQHALPPGFISAISRIEDTLVLKIIARRTAELSPPTSVEVSQRPTHS